MREPRGIETSVSPKGVTVFGAGLSAVAAASGALPAVIRLAMVAKMTTKPSTIRTPIPTTANLSARSGMETQILSGAFDAAEDGERIDRALARRTPDLSRSRIKTLIEEGRVTIGGAPVKASDKARAGQIFAIILPEPIDATPAPQPMALDVLYEDEHLIVIDKPPGLVVHPAPGNPDGTLVNALIAHCGPSLAGIGGERRPGIVHRLDKDTSGLMVAAKTEAGLAGLSRQFADRSVLRAYKAVVWGVPRPAAGTLSGSIARSHRNRKKMAVVKSGGKPARTHYRLEARILDATASLLDCRLETGRTHQIRVHLAEAGHPLVGDPLYGGKRASAAPPLRAFPRQALDAYLLGFSNPLSRRPLRFERKIFSDIKELLESVGVEPSKQ
jgi:23S rRNA pseudouridine1911/1915/1917 synthase